jgi:hypothetical protein
MEYQTFEAQSRSDNCSVRPFLGVYPPTLILCTQIAVQLQMPKLALRLPSLPMEVLVLALFTPTPAWGRKSANENTQYPSHSAALLILEWFSLLGTR